MAALVAAVALTGWYAARPGAVSAPTPDELQLLQQAAPARAPELAAPQAGRTGGVSLPWVTRMSAATGIPQPGVLAYASASLQLKDEQPRCQLGWTTLAGIGWIESQHGTLDGRSLFSDGRSEPAIIGPALDGSGAFAAIPSTPEGAAVHGDVTWDHAVGPMQFITSTWQRWSSDGDGDGVANPHDLDDAAVAAGRYLCASGRDLTTADGWNAAILSYNHSSRYVLDVYAAADGYAAQAAR